MTGKDRTKLTWWLSGLACGLAVAVPLIIMSGADRKWPWNDDCTATYSHGENPDGTSWTRKVETCD